VADQIDGSLVACEEQEKDHREQFIFVQVFAAFLGLHQSGYQIISGISPSRLGQLADVAQEKPNTWYGEESAPARGSEREDLTGPAVKLVAVLDRDTEHLSNYRRWQRQG